MKQAVASEKVSTFWLYLGALAACIASFIIIAPGYKMAEDLRPSELVLSALPSLERKLTVLWCNMAGGLLSLLFGGFSAVIIAAFSVTLLELPLVLSQQHPKPHSD